MIGAVVLVGDELLSGVISDRNVQTIARALASRGVHVDATEIVADDVERIADAVRRTALRYDTVVVTGGLGPTADDVTREAVALALGVPMESRLEVRDALEAFRVDRGLPESFMPYRQAVFPVGAGIVPNPVGSALGIRGRLTDCDVFVLPGVPLEVEAMIPSVLDALPSPPPGHRVEAIVSTAGLSEVVAADALLEGGFEATSPLRLAFLPGPAGVRLRLSAPGGAQDSLFASAEGHIREILGEKALPEPSLPESVVSLFCDLGLTFASAESCTGGLVGAKITDVPGASSMYLGGIVSYANRVKVDRLGVPESLLDAHGAVSGPVAGAMAQGCLRELGADIAVAITGVAGPGGGTPEKPVGTVWIAVADRGGVETLENHFRGPREMVRERSVNKALEMAYRRAVRFQG